MAWHAHRWPQPMQIQSLNNYAALTTYVSMTFWSGPGELYQALGDHRAAHGQSMQLHDHMSSEHWLWSASQPLLLVLCYTPQSAIPCAHFSCHSARSHPAAVDLLLTTSIHRSIITAKPKIFARRKVVVWALMAASALVAHVMQLMRASTSVHIRSRATKPARHTSIESKLKWPYGTQGTCEKR